jgi:hypothetical protein
MTLGEKERESVRSCNALTTIWISLHPGIQKPDSACLGRSPWNLLLVPQNGESVGSILGGKSQVEWGWGIWGSVLRDNYCPQLVFSFVKYPIWLRGNLCLLSGFC